MDEIESFSLKHFECISKTINFFLFLFRCSLFNFLPAFTTTAQHSTNNFIKKKLSLIARIYAFTWNFMFLQFSSSSFTLLSCCNYTLFSPWVHDRLPLCSWQKSLWSRLQDIPNFFFLSFFNSMLSSRFWTSHSLLYYLRSIFFSARHSENDFPFVGQQIRCLSLSLTMLRRRKQISLKS